MTATDSSSPASADQITINIKGPSELKLSLSINPVTTSVSELKAQVEEKTQIEKDRQRLIYSGKVLKDEDMLSTYKIQNGHTLHLVKGAAKPGSTAATTTPGSSTPASSAARTGVPANLSSGMQYAGNPMAHLESVMGHGLGGGNFNPFAQIPGMGDRNLNDPEAINSIMQDPEVISRTMSMMTPEMIDAAIASNPSLAPMGPQLREMMSSPFFRQMMSNPEMVRSIMQMRGGAGMPGMGGMGGFGGMGGGAAGGFPAPGSYDGENRNTSEGNNAAGAGANVGAAANPFASLFGSGAAAGGANPFGGMDPAMMQSMLGGLGGGGAGAGGFGGLGAMGGGAPQPPQDTRPIEERYQSQLLQLNEMGLCDPQQNIRALSMTGGNVNAAIELIFSGSKFSRRDRVRAVIDEHSSYPGVPPSS
ncbi:hypothetical protein QFC22_004908 [Naganishia vaughanmartiniae]|uniref:Uncharacterized protein n=1 Tax=Naganishia vaughanmartiniae TaxID=1424756 RepID=A0ACC2WYJ8_9TREE|nr:hypothetical protein QFC22_004908 [Naganishia vaughanmartiniae]